MKCPLQRYYEHYVGNEVRLEWQDCLKEECAWWDKGFNRCAILGYLHELANVTDELAEIRDEMPYKKPSKTKLVDNYQS